MKRMLAIALLLAGVATAGDFKSAKVIEIHDASELGASVLTNTKMDGQPTDVQPAIAYRCELTVVLEGVSYSAIFPESRHFKSTDFAPGDIISARADGKRLAIETLDGKQLKARITSRTAVK